MTSSNLHAIAENESMTKRRWARYPSDGSPVTVISGNRQFQATTVDESIGGLGIETDEPVALAAGRAVEIVYRDEHSQAHVTAVKPGKNGGCRISLSWEARESSPVQAVEVPFFRFGPVTVVCRYEEGGPGDQKRVTLWDGKTFDVDPGQLNHRSSESRFVELQTMGEGREVIAQLYGLETLGDTKELAERILEFEFRQR